MRTSRLYGTKEPDAAEVESRSFDLAVAVLGMVRDSGGSIPRVIADRLVDVGAATGAAMADAMTGVSRHATLHRMMDARRSAQELDYWLHLVSASELADQDVVQPLREEASALHAALTSLCKKLRQAMESEAVK